MRGVGFLALSRGLFALVDRRDLREIQRYTWTVKFRPRGSAYAVTFIRGGDGKRHMVQLHRFVWNLHQGPLTPVVDHENGWGLGCRWTNLREANHQQNAWNAKAYGSSGVRGVSWHAPSRKWRVRVTVAGKRLSWLLRRKCDAVAVAKREQRAAYGPFARAA